MDWTCTISNAWERIGARASVLTAFADSRAAGTDRPYIPGSNAVDRQSPVMSAPLFTRRLCLSWAALSALGAAHGAGNTLPDLVAAARPSVVPVGTFRATDNPRFSFRGTGFVVGDGSLVVTNFHVLPPAAGGTSGASDLVNPTLMVLAPRAGRELEPRLATLVTSDRSRDLALLRIEGAPLPALTLGDAALVREGVSVAFIGYPIAGILGYSPVTHRGIVASVASIVLPAASAGQLSERAIARLREGPFDIYQLDATAYPGNSGGPVFDVETGRVIGVINMVLIRGTKESALTNPTGISYAIPVRFVRELLQQRGG
jgi:serine protease Do